MSSKKENLFRKVPALVRVLPFAAALAATMPAAVFAQVSPAISELPGTACVPGKGDNSKVDYSTQWGASNTSSTSTAKVYCPFVFDQNDFTNDAQPRFPSVRVLDQNPTSDVSCTLLGVDASATTGYSSGSHKSGGSSSSVQSLALVNANFDNFPFYLIYSMQCTLPISSNGHTSRVASYGMELGD
jgi:hypothetical protein